MRSQAGQSAGTTGAWPRLSPLAALWARPGIALAVAFETEVSERRIFLWLPVAAGAGVALYFSATIEPSGLMIAIMASVFAAVAFASRNKRLIFYSFIALCALCCGMLSAQWRTARVAAPVIDRIRIVELSGFIEEMDMRRQGARFLLRVASAEGLSGAQMPYRVRLTSRVNLQVRAGDFVSLKARLLPPSRAALPGGYDFSRDAFFARIGGVGSVLGKIEAFDPPDPPDFILSFLASVDHARNALAIRISKVMDEEAGAIAVAMVTGKRDLLSSGTRELIREAGIFHIITISGIQMTLVAGIFFLSFRRILALSSTLALNYPIKKWAAGAAMVGTLFYDIATGSRVGTERALFMTLIVFAAVIFDRQALTMRNLAFAALIVIVLEPEAILGVSFQLSFAAVAALVAVYEARMRARLHENRTGPPKRHQQNANNLGKVVQRVAEKLRHGPGGALFATFCATSATASFMAFHFHELSPYVLIGNPLTLIVIEVFAVPGALLGAALYPLGLDAPVWQYVGLGIDFVLWAARHIAAAPGSTLHLNQFAPWSIVFLSLAVLSVVLWRTAIWRASAIPFLAIGLAGATSGDKFDLAIAPGGEALAARLADGSIILLGKRPNAFAGEQWLRAVGDGRNAVDAIAKGSCDALGCTAKLAGGRAVALVLQAEAFEEDCRRASIIVTPLFAPRSCAAETIIDRPSLAASGALTLRWTGDHFASTKSRSEGEDRLWSPRSKFRAERFRPSGSPTKPGNENVEGNGDQNGTQPWL